jgi:hypothetical protein
LANGLRNLLQICCLLDDSTAIIEWSATAKSRVENGELSSPVEGRFGQATRRQAEESQKEDPERDGAVDRGGRAKAAGEVVWWQD